MKNDEDGPDGCDLAHAEAEWRMQDEACAPEGATVADIIAEASRIDREELEAAKEEAGESC